MEHHIQIFVANTYPDGHIRPSCPTRSHWLPSREGVLNRNVGIPDIVVEMIVKYTQGVGICPHGKLTQRLIHNRMLFGNNIVPRTIVDGPNTVQYLCKALSREGKEKGRDAQYRKDEVRARQKLRLSWRAAVVHESAR